MKRDGKSTRKFPYGARVVYVGPETSWLKPGMRGRVDWEYYGGGGLLRVTWDTDNTLARHVLPEVLDFAPVIDQIADLGT